MSSRPKPKTLQGLCAEKSIHQIQIILGFLNRMQRAQIIKEKMDKLSFIKFLNFCSLKDTIEKMKKQATD